MMDQPVRLGRVLGATCLACLLMALVLPPLHQAPSYGQFADQRNLMGVPRAMDVLSNLAFALWGLFGMSFITERVRTRAAGSWVVPAGVYFGGLLLSAGGSAWYHVDPNAAGLAIDRACMVPALAGLMALLAEERVGHRVALSVAVAGCAIGWLAVGIWMLNGNVLPWALFQFGGAPVLLACALLPSTRSAGGIGWLAVLLIYALAKVFEFADHAVFELSNGLISGHTLKHVFAACTAWPVWQGLRRRQHPLPGPTQVPRVDTARTMRSDHGLA